MTKLQHIAIIMDGNGRWATDRSLKRSEGHLAGAKAVREALSTAIEHKIPYLSLYAFSTENWNRPREEVNYLFNLFCDFVQKELPEMLQQGIRLRMVGDIQKLPFSTKKALQYAMEKTKNGTNLELILALNYSGTSEILHAIKQSAIQTLTTDEVLQSIITASKNKTSLKKELTRLFSETSYTETTLREHFFYPELPDPDLIIRTSGELRLSNFYLFQAAYAEFYFTDVLWPDFTKDEFERALEAFAKRKRRFGSVE